MWHNIFFLAKNITKVLYDMTICLFISRSSFLYKLLLYRFIKSSFLVNKMIYFAIFVNNKSPFLSLTVNESRSSGQSILFIGNFKTCSTFISFVSKYVTNFVSILFHLIINPFLKFFPFA
ncbi:hypothetical protein RhiirC2_362355 [Rhizophagus irregularis]|uniref:Uncharacterized protein n=1 Tax=Rhizophagus irregularis TaxID=588596 RepID=A0A2N1NGA1_9GLOM|nr:hypothetical protein RhiirC2_362355 [Rhizophagus irregularis]